MRSARIVDALTASRIRIRNSIRRDQLCQWIVGGAKGGVKSDINVTPLVDVMLVLLIIMMLVAPDVAAGRQRQAADCDATRSTSPKTQGQTVVAIGRDKTMYLNAKPVQEGELATKVNELLENPKEKIVLIKADEEVEYGAVMAAMDQLRQAGIEDIGLITERKKGADGGAGGK